MTDSVCSHTMHRICRRAGLPERGWHSFGTHAAMFGVNPWKLMTWIDETMLYVNFAQLSERKEEAQQL